MAVSEYYREEYQAESGYSVIKIPRHKIKSIWRITEPLLLEGMRVAPALTMSAVLEGLRDESIQLWAVLRDGIDSSELTAVFLTSIERDKGEWVISLYALAGHDARRWLHECDRMMQIFALSEGAKRVRMCGRKAWQRLLPRQFAITGTRGGHFVYERAA